MDLQSEKYGLSFDIKKYTTSGWALGDENVIGIRAFKVNNISFNYFAILFYDNILGLKQFLCKMSDQKTCHNCFGKCFKGVLHPWALFLKTLCIFSKNKATLDKVSYGSCQKCSKGLTNHSFTSVETIVVKLQWKMCENQYFPCFEP